MKKAFTIIELIFVIVILGILAAVALPKFLGVANQAHEANLKAFVGTLNRTIGSTLWSQSMTDGKGGSISGYTNYDESNFSVLSDIPKEINTNSIMFENCGDKNNTSAHFADANITITGKEYHIICKDGNTTNPPTFKLYRGSDCIAGPGC